MKAISLISFIFLLTQMLYAEHRNLFDPNADNATESNLIDQNAINKELHKTIPKNDRQKTHNIDALIAYLNKTNKYGDLPPLHIAVCHKNLAAIQLLIEADMDLNVIDQYGHTPLGKALYGHDNIEIIKLLIKAGADLNLSADKNGLTPLHIAIYRGDLRIIQLLIEAGVNPNRVENDGNTPLHIAIYKNNLAAIQLLIEAGGNLNKANKYGLTPLGKALYFRHTEIIKLLIKAGADLNLSADKDGNTPLLKAIYQQDLTIIKLLLEAGANFDFITYNDYHTALSKARQLIDSILPYLDKRVVRDLGIAVLLYMTRDRINMHADYFFGQLREISHAGLQGDENNPTILVLLIRVIDYLASPIAENLIQQLLKMTPAILLTDAMSAIISTGTYTSAPEEEIS